MGGSIVAFVRASATKLPRRARIQAPTLDSRFEGMGVVCDHTPVTAGTGHRGSGGAANGDVFSRGSKKHNRIFPGTLVPPGVRKRSGMVVVWPGASSGPVQAHLSDRNDVREGDGDLGSLARGPRSSAGWLRINGL